MPESGMSGSVGAAGEQSPVATRRLHLDYWYRCMSILEIIGDERHTLKPWPVSWSSLSHLPSVS